MVFPGINIPSMVIPSGGVFRCSAVGTGGCNRSVSLITAFKCSKLAIFSFNTSPNGSICGVSSKIIADRVVVVVSLCKINDYEHSHMVIRLFQSHLPATTISCASPRSRSHSFSVGFFPFRGADSADVISGMATEVW